jgi:acetyltransferase-like isoleucine patch superfamily enzyme
MRAVLTKVLGYARSVLLAPRLRHWQPFRFDGGLKLFQQNGTLAIGRRAHLWPGVKISISGTSSAPAEVRIGAGSSIGDRTQIHACRLVEIGRDVMISWDVNILENNYHARSRGPIRIEDDVWIACQAIILSGVRIGRGSIVGAGAVVTKDVPPNTVVAGNPARVIRQVTPETPGSAGP